VAAAPAAEHKPAEEKKAEPATHHPFGATGNVHTLSLAVLGASYDAFAAVEQDQKWAFCGAARSELWRAVTSHVQLVDCWVGVNNSPAGMSTFRLDAAVRLRREFDDAALFDLTKYLKSPTLFRGALNCLALSLGKAVTAVYPDTYSVLLDGRAVNQPLVEPAYETAPAVANRTASVQDQQRQRTGLHAPSRREFEDQLRRQKHEQPSTRNLPHNARVEDLIYGRLPPISRGSSPVRTSRSPHDVQGGVYANVRVPEYEEREVRAIGYTRHDYEQDRSYSGRDHDVSRNYAASRGPGPAAASYGARPASIAASDAPYQPRRASPPRGADAYNSRDNSRYSSHSERELEYRNGDQYSRLEDVYRDAANRRESDFSRRQAEGVRRYDPESGRLSPRGDYVEDHARDYDVERPRRGEPITYTTTAPQAPAASARVYRTAPHHREPTGQQSPTYSSPRLDPGKPRSLQDPALSSRSHRSPPRTAPIDDPRLTRVERDAMQHYDFSESTYYRAADLAASTGSQQNTANSTRASSPSRDHYEQRNRAAASTGLSRSPPRQNPNTHYRTVAADSDSHVRTHAHSPHHREFTVYRTSEVYGRVPEEIDAERSPYPTHPHGGYAHRGY
jgi:hypothetical protein